MHKKDVTGKRGGKYNENTNKGMEKGGFSSRNS